jgi:hypothetical protein
MEEAAKIIRWRGRPYLFQLVMTGKHRPSVSLHANGGHTICEVSVRNGELTAIGYAWCSLADQYNREIWRRVSRGRALKLLEEAGVIQEA